MMYRLVRSLLLVVGIYFILDSNETWFDLVWLVIVALNLWLVFEDLKKG